jgi:ubiquitin carboxyl-terminal hydrolase 36/42
MCSLTEICIPYILYFICLPYPTINNVSYHFLLAVPRWDDDDMPNTKVAEMQHSSSTSIGYVLDER